MSNISPDNSAFDAFADLLMDEALKLQQEERRLHSEMRDALKQNDPQRMFETAKAFLEFEDTINPYSINGRETEHGTTETVGERRTPPSESPARKRRA